MRVGILKSSAIAVLVTAIPMVSNAAERVTFTKDVLPILQENCQVCHRPNGANLGGMVAPMAFTTYKETRPWAKSMAKSVVNREMPPWDATEEFHGVFSNERTLTQVEIDTIVAWADQGAKRGKVEDAPTPIEFPSSEGWQIGTPDLVVTMPEPYFVDDDVNDQYVSFRTQLTEEMLPEDRYLKAIEFRPGSSVVHHIISDGLGGLAPGNDPTIMRDGFSSILRAGGNVNWQMHYHKEPGPGTGVWDQSSVALKFYPKGYEPEHEIRIEPLGKMDFRIPAGEANHIENVSREFDSEVMVISMVPHMHLRGKSAKYTAHYPDGSAEVILDVPKYDFNWQTAYEFAEPKVLPSGTTVELEMGWDNSPENPFNPDPTVNVTFGEPTTDEMMFGFMRYALTEEPVKVVLSDDLLNNYAGKYSVGGVREFNVIRRGSVLMIGMGDRESELEPLNEREFDGPFGMKIEFVRNQAGMVESLSLTRGENNTFVAKRVE